MEISDEGLLLIKMFESFRPNWYQCSANVWTIGYGYTEAVRDGEVTGEDLPGYFAAPLTEGEASDLLRRSLEHFEACVEEAAEIQLEQHEFDALVSLAYNIGCGALQDSTLLEHLNAGDRAEAAEQFLVWRYANGEVLEGLIRRRKAEKALFEKDREAAFDIEPEPVDPLPVRELPVSVDIDDPNTFPRIR